jgi:antitoxin component YwqK of YwqJK toxin-antitoxin module
MKKIFTLFAVLLTFPILAQNAIYTDQDGDGVIEYELFKDGLVIEKGFYYNGKMTGTWTSFTPDGKKQMVAKFKNGVKHGYWYVYDNKGRVVTEILYKDDKKVSATQHKYASN